MRSLLLPLLLMTTVFAFTVRAQDCVPGSWHLMPILQIVPQSSGNAGYLGVRLADIDADRAKVLKLGEERGVEIKVVMEGSPADVAGIHPGDILLTYNGETVLGAGHLSRLVQETPPGRRVRVQYWREGKTLTAAVTVGAAPRPKTEPFVEFALPNWAPQDIDVPQPAIVWTNSAVGIEFEPIGSQLAEFFGVNGGVLVRFVQRSSPADKAGVKAGDVIFSVSQRTLSTERDFASVVRQHSAPLSVSLMRNHKRLDVTINLPQ